MQNYFIVEMEKGICGASAGCVPKFSDEKQLRTVGIIKCESVLRSVGTWNADYSMTKAQQAL